MNTEDVNKEKITKLKNTVTKKYSGGSTADWIKQKDRSASSMQINESASL